jgi:hypothetical protein
MDGGYDLGDVAHIGGEEHFGGVGVEEQADRRVQRGFEEAGQAGRMTQGSAQGQLPDEGELLLCLLVSLPDSSQGNRVLPVRVA